MLLIIFGGAFLLGMSWIKLANNHGIYDVMLSSTSIIHNFLKRYHDFDNYLKIFTSLNGSLMLIVIIFGIFIYLKNIKNTAKVICVPLLVFALYFIAIFFVYLTTPYDLVWHISTSVNRLKITLNVLLYGVVLGVLSSLLFSQKQPKILS
jgi:archaellum biogenesis protein FlaJ (TadC family)